jgi:small-conductance mechanosensitive channel
MNFDWLNKGLVFSKYHLTMADAIYIIITYIVIRLLLYAFRLTVTRIGALRKIETGKIYTIRKLVAYAAYTLWAVLSLSQMGIDVTLFLAGSAALLVGVGLGLQHIFNDIVSGFVILFEGVFRVGDIIEVDGLIARVQQIDIRTSRVITRSGIVMVLPNSTMTSNAVTNWSLDDTTTRFQVSVGVKYGSDVRLVETLLLQAVKETSRIDNAREAIVVFNDFGDSALVFDVRFWSSNLWEIDRIKSDLRFRIDELFREHNITIPFPQRDVHFYPQNNPSPSEA